MGGLASNIEDGSLFDCLAITEVQNNLLFENKARDTKELIYPMMWTALTLWGLGTWTIYALFSAVCQSEGLSQKNNLNGQY